MKARFAVRKHGQWWAVVDLWDDNRVMGMRFTSKEAFELKDALTSRLDAQ
jgi:hypothetical protein